MNVAAKKGVVALYIDANRENSRAVGVRVAERFKAAGYTICLCPGSDPGLSIASDNAQISDAALLVTVGGWLRYHPPRITTSPCLPRA